METLDSKVIYEGRILTLQLDTLRYPDGQAHTFEIIAHRDAVTILPIDADDMVWMVRQYRHPARQELLELPAGVCEASEPPEISAARELQEEIGMAARHLEKLGGFWLAPGYSTEYMHVFLARDLYESRLPGDEDESIVVEKIPLAEAMRLAASGQFNDSKTLIALMWAANR
jgi:ADP-ribose pyrophosphatase